MTRVVETYVLPSAVLYQELASNVLPSRGQFINICYPYTTPFHDVDILSIGAHAAAQTTTMVVAKKAQSSPQLSLLLGFLIGAAVTLGVLLLLLQSCDTCNLPLGEALENGVKENASTPPQNGKKRLGQRARKHARTHNQEGKEKPPKIQGKSIKEKEMNRLLNDNSRDAQQLSLFQSVYAFTQYLYLEGGWGTTHTVVLFLHILEAGNQYLVGHCNEVYLRQFWSDMVFIVSVLAVSLRIVYSDDKYAFTADFLVNRERRKPCDRCVRCTKISHMLRIALGSYAERFTAMSGIDLQ
ncbi:hypothetical protein EDC01DRAFT_635171 [Geopyxis carbonaria]|nr:hypothetical protein EDC01DRAFT_635171 [Geopyxis carbonaria]